MAGGIGQFQKRPVADRSYRSAVEVDLPGKSGERAVIKPRAGHCDDERRDEDILAHIRSQFSLSHETYGSPRMQVELREGGTASLD